MKKILTLSVLALGLAFTATAQREAKVSAIQISPAVDFVIPCDDSFGVEYMFMNEGPGTILTGDTLFFSNVRSDSARVWYVVVEKTVNIGDTVAHFGYNMKASQIKGFYDAASNTTKYTQSTPIPNGDFTFFYTPYAKNDAAGLTYVSPLTRYIVDAQYNCNTSVNNLTKTDISVFPNPAQNQITVNFEALASNATLRVIDIMGRTILTKEVTKNTTAYAFDISSLNNGAYYLELVSGEVRGTNKFVVSK